MSELATWVKEQIAQRESLRDVDPEVGHGIVDDLCERVVRAVANGEEGALDAAQWVVILLEREKYENWTRWYA